MLLHIVIYILHFIVSKKQQTNKQIPRTVCYRIGCIRVRRAIFSSMSPPQDVLFCLNEYIWRGLLHPSFQSLTKKALDIIANSKKRHNRDLGIRERGVCPPNIFKFGRKLVRRPLCWKRFGNSIV